MASKMAVIYKISCKDLNVRECYYGSTKNFNKRKRQHKYNCNNENRKAYNNPVYKFIRNNGEWQNWTMNIIDCITSIDKKIYEKCERKYIEENRDIVLNKFIPGRSDKEYKQDNKEKISEYHKQRYQDNKEIIREKSKIYKQNNKEKIIEQGRIYSKQKVNCPICLKSITRSSLYKHKQSLTCLLNKCIIID